MSAPIRTADVPSSGTPIDDLKLKFPARFPDAPPQPFLTKMG
jgi:hypothetical protein